MKRHRAIDNDNEPDARASLAMLEYTLPELNRINPMSAYFVSLAISAILTPDARDFSAMKISSGAEERC